MHKKKIDIRVLLVLFSTIFLFAHAVGAGVRDHNEEKEQLEQSSITLQSTTDFTSPENTDMDLFLEDRVLPLFSHTITSSKNTAEDTLPNVDKSTEDIDTTEENDEFEYVPMSPEIRSFVREMCKFYDFDEEMIYQMIYVESRFHVDAGQDHACKGLMQVSEKYANEYAKQNNDLYEIPEDYDIYDPKTNITLGMRFLDYFRNYCEKRGLDGKVDALNLYNRGWSYLKDHNHFYSDLVLGLSLATTDLSDCGYVS